MEGPVMNSSVICVFHRKYTKSNVCVAILRAVSKPSNVHARTDSVNKNAESVLCMSDDGSVKDSKATFMDD